MAEVTVNKISTDIVENYSKEDLNLIPSFEVVSQFNPETDIVEFSIYDDNNLLQYIDYDYIDYTVTLDYNTQKNSISSVNVNPEEGLIKEGYEQGSYTVIYNFLRNQVSSSISSPYWIKEISSDRTELRITNNDISNEDLKLLVDNFKSELTESPYFEDFEINLGNNNIFLANNILLDSTTEEYTVLIKLYEPLGVQFNVKDTLTVTLQTAEEVSYKVNFPPQVIPSPPSLRLKGPNFNIGVNDLINNSTIFTTKEDLFKTTPIDDWSGSLGELKGILKNKGITPNIDYSDFNNFIYFSSAKERVDNFYYKVGLIQEYSASLYDLQNISSGETSGSISEYQTKITNILENLDEYERYQYYSSGSLDTYPKTNDTKPYNLALTGSTPALEWISTQGISGSDYDRENVDRLVNSLPSYVVDDNRNDQFFLFLDMVGQSFDSIWVYTKDISNRFSADNRLAYGVSKDIVADAIRGMGVNLYQNNFSSDNLSSAFTGINPGGGLLPPTGSDVIETYVSASDDSTIIDDVNKEFYKRIFHNLPLLLKQKGSIAGLRNLINTFGIPDTILRISEFGGNTKNENTPNYYQNKFNYALYNSSSAANNAISATWGVNSDWNSYNDFPESLFFRFKTTGVLPEDDKYSLVAYKNGFPFSLTLAYTGSGYSSSSYDGSIPSSSNAEATLTLWDGTDEIAHLDAPFYDGNWWNVLVSRDGAPIGSATNVNLRAANSIYKGDDGWDLGFAQGVTENVVFQNWINSGGTPTLFIPAINENAVSLGGNSYYGLTGSFQEIRFYNEIIDKFTFYEYALNPHSIKGINPSASADNLIFRAPLGSDLNIDTGSLISIHPKITGSVGYVTNSFDSNSNYIIGNYAIPSVSSDLIFVPQTEYYYYDQPVVGIKNRVSQKIESENLSLPEGDTLSSIRSIQQNYSIPESSSHSNNVDLLEIAFSPQNEINDDINSSMGYFNIGEYIGDPRDITDSMTSYALLDNLRDTHFKKYYTNYNWNDYVRLTKFFDNSLFKMIQDFTPVKSSLSSGVVIKQHILERNKQKPTLVTSSLHEYTGSLTSGFVKGGTGGVFDNINSITSSISPQVTQSWDYTIQTLSGSLNVTQSTQDEFYNGELSGSEYTVTTSNLTRLNTDPITTSSFNVERPNYNNVQISLSPITNAYFNGTTALGNRTAINMDPDNNKITAIAFGNIATNSGGVVTFNFEGYYDLLGIGDNITLLIPGDGAYTTPALNFTITNKVVHTIGSNKNYCFSVEHNWAPIGGWALILEDYRENPPFGSSSGYAPFSGITQIYDGSPINLREIYPDPLLNFVEASRKSTIYQDIDYSSNATTPINFDTLKNNSALRAPIQDSNYTKKSWVNSRYNGTRVSSLDFNTTIER
jgi:hypothetical protein